jgi:hypothetical protein
MYWLLGRSSQLSTVTLIKFFINLRVTFLSSRAIYKVLDN